MAAEDDVDHRPRATVFDFSDRHIGGKQIAALLRAVEIGDRIALQCHRSVFREELELVGARFVTIDGQSTVFEKGLRLRDCTVEQNLTLTDVEATHFVLDRVHVLGNGFLTRLTANRVEFTGLTIDGYTSLDRTRTNQCGSARSPSRSTCASRRRASTHGQRASNAAWTSCSRAGRS